MTTTVVSLNATEVLQKIAKNAPGKIWDAHLILAAYPHLAHRYHDEKRALDSIRAALNRAIQAGPKQSWERAGHALYQPLKHVTLRVPEQAHAPQEPAATIEFEPAQDMQLAITWEPVIDPWGELKKHVENNHSIFTANAGQWGRISGLEQYLPEGYTIAVRYEGTQP